ncbi:MAG: type II toxin-antitoxin system RelE/ParE family toxin [Candidatus Acidiferrales bacterium]|jgi:putative addiction module killer protein
MYIAPGGECPFREFLDGLDNQPVQSHLLARLARLRQGGFGDWKPLDDGVSELRVHHGPGYRLYFGIDGDTVVMLCGGKKSRQNKDLARAKRFWRDYCEK